MSWRPSPGGPTWAWTPYAVLLAGACLGAATHAAFGLNAISLAAVACAGLGAFMSRSPIATVATAPVIYSLLIPLILVDAWASFYQAVSFQAYRLPRVRRSRRRPMAATGLPRSVAILRRQPLVTAPE